MNESLVARVRACAVGFATAAPPGMDAVAEVAEMAEREPVLLLAAQRRLEGPSSLDAPVRDAALELLRAALCRASGPDHPHDHQVAFHREQDPLTGTLVELLTPALTADGDAEATMASFLVDGRPDRRRFVDTVAPRIETAAQRVDRVHIYGEIVAVLWERGQQEAAIALEELWNELATQLPFRLLCGYPTRIFDAPLDIEPLRAVCHHHTEVLPALAA